MTLFKTERIEDDFVDMYYLKRNIDLKDVVLQEEVEDVMWASREKIQELVAKDKFSLSHKEFYDYCLNFLDNNYRS